MLKAKLADFRRAARPLALKVPHWAVLLGSSLATAVIGGVGNYLRAIPTSELLSDLATRAGAVALGEGALVAGASALVGQIAMLIKAWAATHPADIPTDPELPPNPPEDHHV